MTPVAPVAAPALTLSVLVPTYRRAADLERCLRALGEQARPAEEVVVVARRDDAATLELLARFTDGPLPLKVVLVDEPGQVAALNAGLDRVTGDVVAITDDDAAPHADWLARIERRFLDDPTLAGVGGRDFVQGQAEERERRNVGRLSWYGRMVGNHHLGTGPASYVQFLKGANMSYRRSALGTIRFDKNLRGSGAQVHNELGIAFALQRRGWRLLYDPAVAVDHYPGQRHDEDQRDRIVLRAYENRCYNAALSVTRHLAWPNRFAYLVYGIVLGARERPGLLQMLRQTLLERRNRWPVFIPAQRGHLQGWWDAIRTPGPHR